MNLQLLAEDSGDGTGDSTASNIASDDNNTNDKGDVNTDSTNDEGTLKKYTDADVDRIVEEKFKKWTKQQERKIDEAKKLAEMNAQQRAEYERDEALKELEELRTAKSIAEMSKTARSMLNEHSINIDDNLLSVLVTKEAEETQTKVNSFISMFEKAVDAAVNERLKGKTPRKGEHARPTKAEIMNIKNKIERQRAIAENLDLFE